jgi:hypothetical protein
MAAGRVYKASGLGIVDVAWHADVKRAVVRLDDNEMWSVKCYSADQARSLGEMNAYDFVHWCDLKNQQMYPEKVAIKADDWKRPRKISHDPLDFKFEGY